MWTCRLWYAAVWSLKWETRSPELGAAVSIFYFVDIWWFLSVSAWNQDLCLSTANGFVKRCVFWFLRYLGYLLLTRLHMRSISICCWLIYLKAPSLRKFTLGSWGCLVRIVDFMHTRNLSFFILMDENKEKWIMLFVASLCSCILVENIRSV